MTIQLSPYGIEVVNNFDMIGMWLAVLICCRNLSVCINQYKRTKGKIHLLNTAQVSVFLVHRVLYGIIPLFAIKTCVYFPFLVSLWHITYILFYAVMFQRLIILELDEHSRWIKVTGALLITLRFADWPYELAFHSIQQNISDQAPQSGAQCWAVWGAGVIILNFIGDVLANLFLSGMFVRRLFIHIKMSKSLMSHQNTMIESIARKSLIFLALTFVVNLGMNLLKITMFLGTLSDAFTVYFEIIESTLLVEALRNDGIRTKYENSMFCENCQKEASIGNFPNNNNSYHSQTFAKKFHRNSHQTDEYLNSSNIQSYNDTDIESAYISNTIDYMISLEPAILSDKTREVPYNTSDSFSNELPTSLAIQSRVHNTVTDSSLPTSSVEVPYSKKGYETRQTFTTKASSSILNLSAIKVSANSSSSNISAK